MSCTAAAHRRGRIRQPRCVPHVPGPAVFSLPLSCPQDAKHPLLVIGAGANRKVTSNMLRRLVENTGLPFCDTQMGKGVVDSSARPPGSAQALPDDQDQH